MTEKIDLGKIRFNYMGAWNAATTYELNDVVQYGASSYVYSYGVASSGDLPDAGLKWSPLASGVRYRGVFVPNTLYLTGDMVTVAASTYVARQATAGAALPSADAANWAVAMAGSDQCVLKSGDTVAGPLVLSSVLTLNGGISMAGLATEKVNLINAAPAATQPLDLQIGGVHMFLAPAANNFIFNLRGSAATALNAAMAVGQATTLVALVKNGATPFYLSSVYIDGAQSIVNWAGGQPVASGNPSAIDSYALSVIKTANAIFTVTCSRTKFA